MVKHIILWTLKSEYTAQEKESIKSGIKEGLEGLKGKIDGLVDIKVITGGLSCTDAAIGTCPCMSPRSGNYRSL